jgi:two-component system repressor protein LuxO
MVDSKFLDKPFLPRAIVNAQPCILMVEDSLGLSKLYAAFLAAESIRLIQVTSGCAAMELLESELPDLVLLDLQLPDISGMDILRHIHEKALPVSVVMMTAHGSVEAAVEAMKYGAYDFLEKPFDSHRLRTTVRNALESSHLAALVATYREQFDRDRFHGFIGNSPAMQIIYRLIEACASSTATVFITGESGTGKEVCADAIHRQGNRREKPFIAVNCAAIPDSLIESELFGHCRGAFTGAVQDRSGAVSRAFGGTLFLDEIGELPLELQSKLLRFVQTGRFQKVGGNRDEKADVRIICATNRDPWEEVKNGRFREDLYYRLQVVPIQLPPLREHSSDILLLAHYFLQRYSRDEGKNFHGFTPEVEATLSAYEWPGNIRQLQNIIRNITVLHSSEWVQPSHLPPPLDTVNTSTSRVVPTTPPPDQPAPDDICPLAEVERAAIERALQACDGNVPQAAALLQVHPSTIYRKKQAWS